jgi:short-subunit dehydrogenase
MSLPWKSAWITGASTGIGFHIAKQLAAAGVRVTISARSPERLDEAAAGNANLVALPLDVTDAGAVAAAAEKIGPQDLVIFGAGAYTPVLADKIDVKTFKSTMDVNYLGVVNGVAAVLPGMMARRGGHLAWIASVAGYRGLPKAAAYGPSKAALINFAECLKPELDRAGVALSVINPGFVETPLTAQNDFKMPFLMQPEAAATRVIDGLLKQKFEIAFPRRFAAILKLGRVLPYGLYFWLVKKAVLKD